MKLKKKLNINLKNLVYYQTLNHKHRYILHPDSVDLSRISSILHRSLPSISYNFSDLKNLFLDRRVINYFSNIRIINEYPGVYNFMKSRGFNTNLCDQIRSERKETKEKFLKNIFDIHSHTTNPSNNLGLCDITTGDIDFLKHRLFIDIFPDVIENTPPSYDDVISKVRLQTSIGLPNPFLKKRQYLSEIQNILRRFFLEDFSIIKQFYYPSATFLRTQIRSSGVKMRVVHAVQALQLVIESYYYTYISGFLPSNSSITIGKTQLEISSTVSNYKGYYTYSFDYSSWDKTRQQVLSIISFELLQTVVPLTHFERKILRVCRDFYLTLPMFHPTIPLAKRTVGTVSGSGFTSLDNSMCNWIHMTVLVRRYCLRNRIDPYNFDYVINVCGDDLIMGFKQKIKHDSILKNASAQFGSTLRLEQDMSLPGEDRAFFLGSDWIDGLPYRSEKQLVASVVFGSGNYPKMSLSELVLSRFLEIFGNTCMASKYYPRLRLPKVNKIFFFNELFSEFQKGSSPRFTENTYESIYRNNSIDSRGFWYPNPIDYYGLDGLWKTR